MPQKDLKKMTLEQLKQAAKELGLKGYSTLKKAQLIKKIRAAQPGPEQAASAPTPETSRKTDRTAPAPAVAQPRPPEAFDDGHVLPKSYGDTRLVLVPKNSQWAFMHWDLDASARSRLLNGTPRLAVYRGDNRVAFCDLDLDSGHYYLEVPPGDGPLRVVLGCTRGSGFEEIVHSNAITLPRARMSNNTSTEFGTPDWVSGNPGPTGPPRLLSEGELYSLLGKVPVDVPWYKPRRGKAK